MSKAPAIGIDLGTSNVCLAVFRNGKVEIIPNGHGHRRTGTCIAFTPSTCLFGYDAKKQAPSNPSNTIFGAMRLIGRKFEDPSVQSDLNYWPFTVINDRGWPKLEAEYRGQKKSWFPEEVLSMHLANLKEDAAAYLGTRVTDAVIAVPAFFNYSQRQAILEAAARTGLRVLRLVMEPVAAAMGVGQKRAGELNVLVFDLGGCNCNVSILTIENEIYEVKSVAGGNHLGGEDFNNRMVDYFAQEFKVKYEKDLTGSKEALCRLRNECEMAKMTLSGSDVASIEMDSLYEGIDFYSVISRSKFEELNADLFQGSLNLVEKALRDAKMDKAQIHEIVVVGGSSRVPRIQELLQDFFGGKGLNKSGNPYEAVASGAAVQAAILHGDRSEAVQLLLDLAPISLGIETCGGQMTALVRRSTTIPTKQMQTYTTYCDKQTEMLFQIYEGEGALTKDNTFLGQFELTGIPLARHGVPDIEVTFDIDASGELIVIARLTSTGRESSIMISNDKCRSTRTGNNIEGRVNKVVSIRRVGNGKDFCKRPVATLECWGGKFGVTNKRLQVQVNGLKRLTKPQPNLA